MLRVRKVSCIASLVLVLCAAAHALAQAESLTAEQHARQRAVEQQLMAPCCFGGTIADHRSPLSDQIREEVRGLVLAGQTEKQILDYFLEKYGERILAAPRASGFNLLAWVMPALGLVLGAVIVLLFLAHHRGGAAAADAETGPKKVESYQPSVEQQFKRELERFNA